MEPYLVLLRVGFAVPVCYQTRGALLPHRFTLTTHPTYVRPFGGLLSVALSVGSRRPGVTWHSALWSPDFPPLHCCSSDRPADSAAESTQDPLPLQEESGLLGHPFNISARSYKAFFLWPVILAAKAAACFTGSSANRMPSIRSASVQSSSAAISGIPPSTNTISPRC